MTNQLLAELEMANKEIERLNNELENLEKLNNANYQSFIEVNNIINELEKELKDMATLKTDKYGNTRKITHIDINWLLLKIKELKGDGSNG